MMAEAEALNGIFAADDITYDWFKAKGMEKLPYPRIAPGAQANYVIDEVVDLSTIEPMIAKPYSPGNAHPADTVAEEKIKFDKAYIGSCTNGSYDDLLSAAHILKAGRAAGYSEAKTDFVIFPGSGGVKMMIEQPDPRLGGDSIADTLRQAGGKIRDSWCGPCFGQGPDALKEEHRIQAVLAARMECMRCPARWVSRRGAHCGGGARPCRSDIYMDKAYVG